jgi:hypothetical protein
MYYSDTEGVPLDKNDMNRIRYLSSRLTSDVVSIYMFTFRFFSCEMTDTDKQKNYTTMESAQMSEASSAYTTISHFVWMVIRVFIYYCTIHICLKEKEEYYSRDYTVRFFSLCVCGSFSLTSTDVKH